MIPLVPKRIRHEKAISDNSVWEQKTHQQGMSEVARQIIREQWTKRHDPSPLVRRQAKSLIRTHIHLLRGWSANQAA